MEGIITDMRRCSAIAFERLPKLYKEHKIASLTLLVLGSARAGARLLDDQAILDVWSVLLGVCLGALAIQNGELRSERKLYKKHNIASLIGLVLGSVRVGARFLGDEAVLDVWCTLLGVCVAGLAVQNGKLRLERALRGRPPAAFVEELEYTFDFNDGELPEDVNQLDSIDPSFVEYPPSPQEEPIIDFVRNVSDDSLDIVDADTGCGSLCSSSSTVTTDAGDNVTLSYSSTRSASDFTDRQQWQWTKVSTGFLDDHTHSRSRDSQNPMDRIQLSEYIAKQVVRTRRLWDWTIIEYKNRSGDKVKLRFHSTKPHHPCSPVTQIDLQMQHTGIELDDQLIDELTPPCFKRNVYGRYDLVLHIY